MGVQPQYELGRSCRAMIVLKAAWLRMLEYKGGLRKRLLTEPMLDVASPLKDLLETNDPAGRQIKIVDEPALSEETGLIDRYARMAAHQLTNLLETASERRTEPKGRSIVSGRSDAKV